MTYIYLDTERSGLDATRHQVWEIAYAIDDESVGSSVVPHDVVSADRGALEVGEYYVREGFVTLRWDRNVEWEWIEDFEDNGPATLVGANPAFDAGMLKARWGGKTPWHYRLLDIEAYAMGALGYEKPQSLKTIVADLRDLGYEITESNHTAANDVDAVRDAHKALRAMYEQLPLIYNNR